MNRCLAYACRLRERADSVFFSLASAIEIIEAMGFEAEYFVSPNWSDNTTFAWNSELAVRLGLLLEYIKPSVVVFDGTWPFQGLLAACRAYGSPRLVWSNRGLLKGSAVPVPVPEEVFDLVIVPGELGGSFREIRLEGGTHKIHVPPVSLLDGNEILTRAEARAALGLDETGGYVLFSLGAGNLNDVSGVGSGLIRQFQSAGFRALWTRAPISLRNVELPSDVIPLSIYPLVRYLRAFDYFVGAAGYNTCCEVVQVGIPSLLVPNELTRADNQIRRASLVAEHAPVVVSSCSSEQERRGAVEKLLGLHPRQEATEISMNGAQLAADAILALANHRGYV